MDITIFSDLSSLFISLAVIFLSICIGYYLANRRNKKIVKPASAPQLQKPAANINTGIRSASEKKMLLEDTITIIKQLSENISSPLGLNELGMEIVRTTARIMGVEICTLLLLDESGDTLSVLAAEGIDEKSASEVKIRKGDEISGLVAQYNEIKIINDLANTEQASNLKYDNYYKNSLISIPLSLKNNVLGVLNVSNRKSQQPFSSMDAEILQVVALESSIAIQNFRLLKDQQKNYLNTIIALASALDMRDPYTYLHSECVTKYALRIAREMNLHPRLIEDIRYAALLHDIGKIGIKDGVLLKPEALTEEEYAQIKLHPINGEEIVKALPFLQGAAKLIRHHHERIDGKGYPDGIRGERIELGAKILALADSFDAMTTKRIYHDALNLEEAKKEISRKKNTQFDAAAVDCLLKILEKEPEILIKNKVHQNPSGVP